MLAEVRNHCWLAGRTDTFNPGHRHPNASVSMQQCITGLLLVSTLCAAALSHPSHPYTVVFPKRILLQHLVRYENSSQVPYHPSLILQTPK